MARNILNAQVKHLTRRGVTGAGQEHDILLIQQVADGLMFNTTNFTRVLIIDTMDNTKRLRRDEITADHANAGAVHWRPRNTD